MSKKAYRSTATAIRPAYPRLTEVNRRSMLDWGVLAAGAVWLGSAGCDKSLVGSAEAREAKPKTEQIKAKTGQLRPARLESPDGGAPAEPGKESGQAPRRKMGEAPAARVAPDAGAAAPAKPAEPPTTLPPPGVPPVQRVDPPKPVKQPDAKGHKSSRKDKEPVRLAGKPMPPRVLEAPDAGDASAPGKDGKADNKAPKPDKP